MEWETEKLKKTMFTGEYVVWGTRIKTIVPREERMELSWRDRNVYFTVLRVLWDLGGAMPEEIRYSEIIACQQVHHALVDRYHSAHTGNEGSAVFHHHEIGITGGQHLKGGLTRRAACGDQAHAGLLFEDSLHG